MREIRRSPDGMNEVPRTKRYRFRRGYSRISLTSHRRGILQPSAETFREVRQREVTATVTALSSILQLLLLVFRTPIRFNAFLSTTGLSGLRSAVTFHFRHCIHGLSYPRQLNLGKICPVRGALLHFGPDISTLYQLAFFTPGINPAEAISRNWIRLIPNRRIYPFGRPVILQRLC